MKKRGGSKPHAKLWISQFNNSLLFIILFILNILVGLTLP